MDRWLKKYRKMGNFTIEPWDSRYYGLFDGDELVCVTAYKKGAIEVMKRLSNVKKCQHCPFNKKGRKDRQDNHNGRKVNVKGGNDCRNQVRGLI